MLGQREDFPTPVYGVLFAQNSRYPTVATVYTRVSSRPSKATDVYLNQMIGSVVRHQTSKMGTCDGEGNVVSYEDFVAFNSCEDDDDWNASLLCTSARTRIKGDVLILRYDARTCRFQSMSSEDLEKVFSTIMHVPLSMIFSSMKNCR